tara:strand:- start:2714 stop:4015 length:1302 start_codon:yes stop_codon:yes gene_type:complete
MEAESELIYNPHKYQAEIHANLKRFSVLVCHRRFGKTFLAIATLIDAAISTERENLRFAYVAPYQKQAKQVAWDYLKQFALPIHGTVANESETSITFLNGARVRLYGSDNGQAMRGLFFDGVICDEIADFRPETWPEIIRPALTDSYHKGWCLFIGTPKGLNQFYDLYQYAIKDPTWYAGMYRVDETDILDDEEVQMARNTMAENQYRREFLCDFGASMDNALITIDKVADAVAIKRTEAEVEGSAKILGVDVARFGSDRSVIQKRKGLAAYEPKIFDDIDNMTLAGMVAQTINEWEPDAVFIDAGRGEGVIDRLRQLGYFITEVNFGGKALKPMYNNKRSEMWDGIRIWLDDGGSLPPNVDLKTDLCVPTYKFDSSNRLQLESKDDIKKRGGRSPDLGDALALTFSYPVAAKKLGHFGFKQEAVVADYDPFE